MISSISGNFSKAQTWKKVFLLKIASSTHIASRKVLFVELIHLHPKVSKTEGADDCCVYSSLTKELNMLPSLKNDPTLATRL